MLTILTRHCCIRIILTSPLNLHCSFSSIQFRSVQEKILLKAALSFTMRTLNSFYSIHSIYLLLFYPIPRFFFIYLKNLSEPAASSFDLGYYDTSRIHFPELVQYNLIDEILSHVFLSPLQLKH